MYQKITKCHCRRNRCKSDKYCPNDVRWCIQKFPCWVD